MTKNFKYLDSKIYQDKIKSQHSLEHKSISSPNQQNLKNASTGGKSMKLNKNLQNNSDNNQASALFNLISNSNSNPNTILALVQAKLSNDERLLLDTFFYYDANCTKIFPSVQTLANKSYMSPRSVHRYLKKLVNYGLISKTYRHCNTSLYRVNPVFRDPFVREKLKYMFKFLAVVPLVFSMLLSGHPGNFLFATKRGGDIKQGYLDIYTPSVIEYQCSKKYPANFYKNKRKKMARDIESVTRRLKNKIYGASGSLRERHLKLLGLSLWGEVKLAAFDAKVIDAAIEIFKHCTASKDPFKYFMKLCLQESQKLKLEPNWGLTYKLASYLGQPEDASMTTKDPINQQFKTIEVFKTHNSFEPKNLKKEDKSLSLRPYGSAYRPYVEKEESVEDKIASLTKEFESIDTKIASLENSFADGYKAQFATIALDALRKRKNILFKSLSELNIQVDEIKQKSI